MEKRFRIKRYRGDMKPKDLIERFYDTKKEGYIPINGLTSIRSSPILSQENTPVLDLIMEVNEEIYDHARFRDALMNAGYSIEERTSNIRVKRRQKGASPKNLLRYLEKSEIPGLKSVGFKGPTKTGNLELTLVILESKPFDFPELHNAIFRAGYSIQAGAKEPEERGPLDSIFGKLRSYSLYAGEFYHKVSGKVRELRREEKIKRREAEERIHNSARRAKLVLERRKKIRRKE